MTSDTTSLDGWNYTLFFVETIMNAAYIPVFIIFFYICVAQKNLHVNFRATLFFVGVGNLIGAIHRLILVTARVCCIGRSDAPIAARFQFIYLHLDYLPVLSTQKSSFG
ncbi:hypothetical protein GCK32_008809 [Trichostrongylus colubriformis]|uniref:Uncharacterized protein n=1 Tax=Trichostrongylus colubriformis TaxID=6319 RepID=A0AAN8FFA1_TRICO